MAGYCPTMLKRSIEITKWKNVKNEISPLGPKVEQQVNQYDGALDNELVIRARYPFGSAIEKNGQFNLFLDNKLVAYKSNTVPAEIGQLLNYRWKAMPLTMVAHGSIEMFVDLPSHIIPLHLYRPGEMLALYGLYDQGRHSNLVRQAYCCSAGARSLLTLPKISHGLYNQRLGRRFAISEHLCPKSFEQQWHLFHELCHSPILPSHWYSELILFSAGFVETMKSNLELENQILQKMLELTTFSRSQAMYDLLWSIFIEKYSLAIRSTPSILETAKHLIKLAMGEAPGYAPAIDDVSGPIEELIDIYLNVYKIRYYLPVFMCPYKFIGTHPVYYSLHRHTFFHSIPEKTSASRTIDELKKIREVIMSFKSHVLEDKFPFPVTDTTIYKTLKSIEFDFFHPQGDDGLQTDIGSLMTEDPRFNTLVKKAKADRGLTLPDHSVFFNGCIRIRPAKMTEHHDNSIPRPQASMKDFLATIRR